MRNFMFYFIVILSITFLFQACGKKDFALDSDTVRERQLILDSDIKTRLQNATNGFLFYPENASLSTQVTRAANFTMRFDTLTNKVTMSSSLLFYRGPSTSYFQLSSATGMPLLTFSTDSYISQIYASGDKGITDFFFRVMKISGDTIKVQPYRKGQIYASEGGAVFNMLRR